MVLVTDNRSGDLAYTAKTFFSSLKKGFTIGIRTGLIYIESDNSSYSTIQLNASSLYRGCEFIPLETENLFSYDDKDSRFFYLYGQDSEYRLKRSKPEDIVEIGGQATSLDAIDFIYGITFTLPDGEQMQGLFKPPEAKRAEHRHFHDYDQEMVNGFPERGSMAGIVQRPYLSSVDFPAPGFPFIQSRPRRSEVHFLYFGWSRSHVQVPSASGTMSLRRSFISGKANDLKQP